VSLLAWIPESRIEWILNTAGLISTLEMVVGLFIEVTTCVYLKSVCVVKRTSIRWKDMGRYEFSAFFVGLLLILAVIAGTLLGPTILAPVTRVFMTVYLLFHSLLCCSLVSSVDEFKEKAKKLNKSLKNSGVQSSGLSSANSGQ
jgi:hypothetical protein